MHTFADLNQSIGISRHSFSTENQSKKSYSKLNYQDRISSYDKLKCKCFHISSDSLFQDYTPNNTCAIMERGSAPLVSE